MEIIEDFNLLTSEVLRESRETSEAAATLAGFGLMIVKQIQRSHSAVF